MCLEGLVEGFFSEALDEAFDGVGLAPGFGAVVAWSQSVGVVCLIDD